MNIIPEKSSRGGMNPQGETEGFKEFTVLYMEGFEFKRGKAEGKVISVDKPEIVIETSFPLQPKQVVYWVDKHKKGNVHFATVKLVKRTKDTYRVGLSLL
jgi:hypothetical protein